MEALLQCARCSERFDLDARRPACLACGDSVCLQCLNDPAWERKCPTCAEPCLKDFMPDNKLVIQIMESEAGPAAEGEAAEDEAAEDEAAEMEAEPEAGDDLQALVQRGLEVGESLVSSLELEVPTAVQTLRKLLDRAVSHLQMLKVCYTVLQQVGGPDVYSRTDRATTHMLEQTTRLAAELEESHAIISGKELSLMAYVDDTSLRHKGPLGILGRLTLLNMQMHGLLLRESEPGRPLQAEQLPLTEVTVDNGDDPRVMEALRGMKTLRRMRVAFDSSADKHPDLPSELEELTLTNPSERDLQRVCRMPYLRRLAVLGYDGPYVSFEAAGRPPGAGLQELAVDFKGANVNTLMSMASANAASLTDLTVGCDVAATSDKQCAALGAVLAACGLSSLERLVLRREHCGNQRALCDKQRQAIEAQLTGVTVSCRQCGDLPPPFWKNW